MSDKQNPKDIKNEQQETTKATDELTGKELDQVVGGGDPSSLHVPPAQSGEGLNDDEGKLDGNPLERFPHYPLYPL